LFLRADFQDWCKGAGVVYFGRNNAGRSVVVRDAVAEQV
jgi:hypothetical protein